MILKGSKEATVFPSLNAAMGSYSYIGVWKDKDLPIYYKEMVSDSLQAHGPHLLYRTQNQWFVGVIIYSKN